MSMLYHLIAIRVAGKIDDLKSKYPEFVNEIDEISRRDPSRKNKYVEWAVKQLYEGHTTQDIIPTLELFDKNQNRLKNPDINQYDLKDLESELKELPQSKRQEKIDSKTEGSKKLYEDDQFLFIRIESKRACVEYGRGTKWCITMENASYYSEYISENVVFYFLINKKPSDNDNDKIAYAVQRDLENQIIKTEMFDSADRVIKKNPYSISGKIDQIIQSDAPEVPMGKLAKLKGGLASESELIKLADDPDPDVRWRVARHPSTPTKVLASMAEDSDERVRRYVAQNHRTPASALARMSEDSNSGVRLIISMNPKTPADALDRLSGDSDQGVRYQVALNPNTPTSVLDRLSEDSDSEIRRRVARHPSTPASVLARLSEDSDSGVRQIVARNRSTPTDVLVRLSEDSNEGVRYQVAQNHRTPASVLDRLSGDSDQGVRYQVAQNHNTPTSALDRMSGDSDEEVRRQVARNPSTSASVLARMAEDEDSGVRWEVANNPKTPTDVLARLRDGITTYGRT